MHATLGQVCKYGSGHVVSSFFLGLYNSASISFHRGRRKGSRAGGCRDHRQFVSTPNVSSRIFLAGNFDVVVLKVAQPRQKKKKTTPLNCRTRKDCAYNLLNKYHRFCLLPRVHANIYLFLYRLHRGDVFAGYLCAYRNPCGLISVRPLCLTSVSACNFKPSIVAARHELFSRAFRQVHIHRRLASSGLFNELSILVYKP